MKKPAWSYSALNSFETCPRKHYLTRVSKEVKEPRSKHLDWGIEVHNTFERFLNGDEKKLPDWFNKWRGIAEKVRAARGTVKPEVEVALTERLQSTGWFDYNVWVRGKLDVVIENGSHIHVLDWKTGKRREDSEQLELFAALAFILFPTAEKITCTFIWLEANAKDTEVYTREDIPSIWGNFLPRVERFNQAHAENVWPAKPSGLCNKYCAVPNSKCAHSGQVG